MKKGLLIAVILGFFLNTNVWASMVLFYIVETGLPENGQISQQSVAWENAFMDVFFDAGYIVSNYPILRMETKPSADILQYISINFSEARNMGINFLIITQLDYNAGSQYPAEITFSIYKTATNEKILERQLQGRTYRTTREEFDDIRSIIRNLTPYIR